MPNHTGSIAQRSVSNRDAGAEAAPARPSRTATAGRLAESTSRLESVPGYRPLSRVSHLLRAVAPHDDLREVGPVGRPARIHGPPLDAAVGGVREGRLLEIVIGDDDRVAVQKATESPWRHICALRISTQTGKSFVGTGWFIGPRTVMTAGHCVYMRDEGGWAATIEVIPALNGSERPYGSEPGVHFKAVREWTEGDGDSNYDFGAILLDKPLGERAGWFAFASLPDATLAATTANISGYPADRDHATRQYFHARRLLGIQAQRLVYDIDTYGGQSGSAIWLNLEDRRIAVGIHTTGASTTNSGTRITDEVFAFMERWRQEAGDGPAAGEGGHRERKSPAKSRRREPRKKTYGRKRRATSRTER